MITAIYQDRAGFVWVGSRDGLFRYDGHSFIVFEHVACRRALELLPQRVGDLLPVDAELVRHLRVKAKSSLQKAMRRWKKP